MTCANTYHDYVPDKEAGLTHKYLRYEPQSNELVAYRKLRLTVNTLGIGRSHDEYGSGENISFTNNFSDISFSPSWYGFRDQAKVEYQGVSGYLSPTSRVPVSDLISVEPYGAAHTTNTITYNLESQALGNHSVYGIGVVLGEDVSEEDWVSFLVYFGHGDDKVLAFRGQFTGSQHAAGTRYDRWFGGTDGDKAIRKVEFFLGQDITTTMKINRGGEDGPLSDLIVMASATNPLVHHSRIWLRSFEDKDINCGITPVSSNHEIAYTSDYAADTSDGTIRLTVNESVGYKSFVVFDSAGTFHQSSCVVVIDVDTYELDKKDKQYNFWKEGANWKWSEIDRESK